MQSPIINDKKEWSKINDCLCIAIIVNAKYELNVNALALLVKMIAEYNRTCYITSNLEEWSIKLSYIDIAEMLEITNGAARYAISLLKDCELISIANKTRQGKSKTEYCLNVELLQKLLNRYFKHHPTK